MQQMSSVLSEEEVKIHFYVTRSGQVRGARISQGKPGSTLAGISYTAVVNAEIAPMPPEVAEMLPGGELEYDLGFDFYHPLEPGPPSTERSIAAADLFSSMFPLLPSPPPVLALALWDFTKDFFEAGGPFMVPLALCAGWAVVVTIQRFLALRRMSW